MEAKLDGKKVWVITLDGAMIFGVYAELSAGVGVQKGEFPDRGEVYFWQDNEGTEIEDHYDEIMAAAEANGIADEFPSLEELSVLDGLIAFKATYHVVKVARNEYMMAIDSVERLECEYVVDEDDNLIIYDPDADEEMDEESVEEMRAHWRDFILPIPPAPKKASDEVYLTLAYEYYDLIKSGEKRTEYRAYTENYVKRLLSHPIRTVKFQRGYGGPGHAAPEQMVWTVTQISLYESATDTKGDPRNPPEGILPDYIAIDLGKRVK